MFGGGKSYGISAIKTDGTLWAWGKNEFHSGGGQLGDSSTTGRSSPVQIGSDTTWKACFMSGTNGGGTKTDGTLWTWGRGNQVGPLGHNNKTDYSSPKQVGSDTGWDSVQGGWDNNMFFLKENGTLWACGTNTLGSLGLNQPITQEYSSPKQIPGTTWAKLNANAGYSVNVALKTDGTLWGWGSNYYGQLGQNARNTPDNNQISSPVQIPGTDWSDVSAYDKHVIASKTDGTLWGIGYNGVGDLGQSSTTYYSSPVQIPGTWSQGLAGNGNTLGWKA